jgi:hypothetical protein
MAQRRRRLARESIAILSGRFNQKQITALGFEPIGRDESLSFIAQSDQQKSILKSQLKISVKRGKKRRPAKRSTKDRKNNTRPRKVTV